MWVLNKYGKEANQKFHLVTSRCSSSTLMLCVQVPPDNVVLMEVKSTFDKYDVMLLLLCTAAAGVHCFVLLPSALPLSVLVLSAVVTDR